jgi:CheY-like chemotaxis protein
VENGQELLDYLKRGGKYADEAAAPCPDLILLDLNMPKKDGRSALKEIKSDPKLKRIPIVIFTTSNADTDICAAYDLGVNSFVAKPLSFKDLVEVMRVLSKYWFEVVELPDASTGC